MATKKRSATSAVESLITAALSPTKAPAKKKAKNAENSAPVSSSTIIPPERPPPPSSKPPSSLPVPVAAQTSTKTIATTKRKYTKKSDKAVGKTTVAKVKKTSAKAVKRRGAQKHDEETERLIAELKKRKEAKKEERKYRSKKLNPALKITKSFPIEIFENIATFVRDAKGIAKLLQVSKKTQRLIEGHTDKIWQTIKWNKNQRKTMNWFNQNKNQTLFALHCIQVRKCGVCLNPYHGGFKFPGLGIYCHDECLKVLEIDINHVHTNASDTPFGKVCRDYGPQITRSIPRYRKSSNPSNDSGSFFCYRKAPLYTVIKDFNNARPIVAKEHTVIGAIENNPEILKRYRKYVTKANTARTKAYRRKKRENAAETKTKPEKGTDETKEDTAGVEETKGNN